MRGRTGTGTQIPDSRACSAGPPCPTSSGDPNPTPACSSSPAARQGTPSILTAEGLPSGAHPRTTGEPRLVSGWGVDWEPGGHKLSSRRLVSQPRLGHKRQKESWVEWPLEAPACPPTSATCCFCRGPGPFLGAGKAAQRPLSRYIIASLGSRTSPRCGHCFLPRVRGESSKGLHSQAG